MFSLPAPRGAGDTHTGDTAPDVGDDTHPGPGPAPATRERAPRGVRAPGARCATQNETYTKGFG